MATAKEAKEWVASGGLHGLGDSLYTPFSGERGDDIDWDAYRTLVRYCIDDLEHDMLWLTSGCAEFWSLTVEERKQLLEVAVQEARAINPNVVVQACTSSACAKDALELTQHAQEKGADIAFIQTPSMEVHGGEGVLRFVEFIAERTDIALGLFNSAASGYVMTGAEMAEICNRIPAVVAIKEGVMDSFVNTVVCHSLAPDVLIWETDFMVYEAGWLQDGIVCSGQLGNIGWMQETVDNKSYTNYWRLIWEGKIQEAKEYRKNNPGPLDFAAPQNFGQYPKRLDYFTHWGEPLKIGAAVLGLPVGDYPYSRPPQARMTDEAAKETREYYEATSIAGKALNSRAVMGASAVAAH